MLKSSTGMNLAVVFLIFQMCKYYMSQRKMYTAKEFLRKERFTWLSRIREFFVILVSQVNL